MKMSRLISCFFALALSVGSAFATVLPLEYEQCEYIAGNGSQYIKTGVVPNGRVPVVHLKYRMGSTAEGVYVFGYWNASENAGTAVGWHNNQFWLRTWKTSGGWGNVDQEPHVVELNTDNGTFVDGVLASSVVGGLRDDSRSEYYLLGRYFEYGGNISAEPVSSLLYEVTIWMDGVKEREFVPCRRLSDGVVGLYDLVHGIFYSNANSPTGNFTAGPAVVDKHFIVAEIGEAPWRGQSDGPHPEVRDEDDNLLAEGTDYSLAWVLDAGLSSATMRIVGRGEHAGHVSSVTYVPTFTTAQRRMFFDEVEYLESLSNTTAIIKTGVVPNGRIPTVRIKYRMMTLDEDKYVFGYWNGDESAGTAVGWHNNQFWLRTWKTSGGGYGTADTNDIHVVELNTATGTYVDGVLAHGALAGIRDDSISEYYLMGRCRESGGKNLAECTPCRLYEATIWTDGVKEREFVPCRIRNGTEFGLFDKVHGRFYRNAGWNSFTGPAFRQPLEYIESAGGVSIVTDIHPEVDRRVPTIQFDFQFTDIGTDGGLWPTGYWDGNSSVGGCGTAFGIYTDGEGKRMFRQRVGTVAEDIAPADTERHIVLINSANGSFFDKKKIVNSLLDGTVEEPGNETDLLNHDYYLFGRKATNDDFGKSAIRIYGFKLWLNGELAADLRPVRMYEDGNAVFGLYDEVSGAFYPCTGSAYTAGPAVVEAAKKAGFVLRFM